MLCWARVGPIDQECHPLCCRPSPSHPPSSLTSSLHQRYSLTHSLTHSLSPLFLSSLSLPQHSVARKVFFLADEHDAGFTWGTLRVLPDEPSTPASPASPAPTTHASIKSTASSSSTQSASSPLQPRAPSPPTRFNRFFSRAFSKTIQVPRKEDEGEKEKEDSVARKDQHRRSKKDKDQRDSPTFMHGMATATHLAYLFLRSFLHRFYSPIAHPSILIGSCVDGCAAVSGSTPPSTMPSPVTFKKSIRGAHDGMY